MIHIFQKTNVSGLFFFFGWILADNKKVWPNTPHTHTPNSIKFQITKKKTFTFSFFEGGH